MTDAVVLAAPTSSAVTIDRLLGSFLAGRSPNTMRAYSKAIEQFAAFVQQPTIADAAQHLLTKTPGEANAIVLEYQAHMKVQGMSAATINHRLSAVRSMVKLARMLGLVSWSLEVGNVVSKAYRDTRGPGQEGVKRMLGAIQGDSAKAARDAAIIRLLFDRGLRRGEVASLDLSDLDAENARIRVVGKGKTEGEWLTLSRPTLAAIDAWLRHRGGEAGPLFTNLDPVALTGRLTVDGIYFIIVQAGQKAGLGHVRPHGLRHAAITTALDRTNGDIRAVSKFARHARADTTMAYDDNRKDLGGQISQLISE